MKDLKFGGTSLADSSRMQNSRLLQNVLPGLNQSPGGVGPMTIAMLLKNTLSAANKEFYQ